MTPAAAPGTPAIEVMHASIARGGRTILRDVQLTVAPGEFVGVIGGNGAGKTTLLRALLGRLQPSAGAIRVFGVDPRRASGRVGFVPQKVVLEADVPLRARDFVGLGYDGERWGVGLPNRRRRERVEAALREVDALGFADEPVGRLSGGEQQRLTIAQAIVREPALLVLDEPLANLDLRSSDEIVALVARLRERTGLTVLMVAHDVNPLLPVMDRVIYLGGGRAAIGAVADVVTTESLSALFGHPVDVVEVRGRIVVISCLDAEAHVAGAVAPHDRALASA